ncbi:MULTISPECIES: hypothetical protein [Halorussus]|uniref:hypothetical protein n=1 Tax=Halorussus TaxID=1070314 RepID=UPI0020A12758|nr:hypothetical protein [Halorussus vallis]USZ74664.1 hypothetical protein NGM07_14610 [Halorussus vallis]
MRKPSTTRRRLLAGIAGAGVGSLAGCTCPGVNFDVQLRVDVVEIERSGDGYVGRAEVRTPPRPWDEEDANEYGASYDDVTFLGYDPVGNETVRVSFGEFDPGTTKRRTFRSASFPLVVTAAAADASTSSTECTFVVTGAQVCGYLGYFDGDGRAAERSGHVWETLRRRELDTPLPPDDRVFERLKCKHRVAIQPHPPRPLANGSDEGPNPDLSLVPNADSWAGRRIPFPTVRETYEFGAGRRANDEELRQYEEWDATVPFERCPTAIREAIRDHRPIGWVAESEFFDGVSRLEGETVDGPGRLPTCNEENVSCGDNRRADCRDGPQFRGRYFRHLRYFTEFEGEAYPVTATYQKRWLSPDAPDDLPPCTERREEQFELEIVPGLKVRDELEAAVVPDWIRGHIRNYDGIGRYSVPREKWERAISILQGRSEPQLPGCRWSNVHCNADSKVHCGEGFREAIYWTAIDEVHWSLTLTYEWRNLPKETASDE